MLHRTSMKIRTMNTHNFTLADHGARGEGYLQYVAKYSIVLALYCLFSVRVSQLTIYFILPTPRLCAIITAAQQASVLGGSLRGFDAMM